MAISNFGELKAAIQNWAARSDQAFVNRLGDFVQLAEDRIYNGGRAPLESPAIRTKEMATAAPVTTTGGSVALPDRFLEAYRIYFDGQPERRLSYMSPREFHTAPRASVTDQLASWYTVEGNTLLIGPNIADGTAQLGYYQRFVPLGSVSGDGDTNPLLLSNSSLFLYAGLVAAFSWARNSAQATENFAIYSSMAEGVQQAAARADRSGQSLWPMNLEAV